MRGMAKARWDTSRPMLTECRRVQRHVCSTAVKRQHQLAVERGHDGQSSSMSNILRLTFRPRLKLGETKKKGKGLHNRYE